MWTAIKTQYASKRDNFSRMTVIILRALFLARYPRLEIAAAEYPKKPNAHVVSNQAVTSLASGWTVISTGVDEVLMV